MTDKIFDLVRTASEKTEFLNFEQERDLIIKAQKGDSKASEKLFCANSRFILKISSGYAQKYGLTLEDTFSAACEGFLKAVQKFDTKNENRLITLATFWIKSKMQEELYRSHAIKIPHNLLHLLKTDDSENDEDLKNTSLLNACGKIASLDESFGDEEDSWCLYDIISSSIEDPERVVEQHEMQRTIEEVMKNNLSEREIFVLKLVFGLIDGQEHSLSEVGKQLGCSKQRADQIKRTALVKLRHPRVFCKLKDLVA